MNHSESILRARDALLADKGRFLESIEDLCDALAYWDEPKHSVGRFSTRRDEADEAVQAMASLLSMYWSAGRRPMTIEETAIARILDRLTRPMVETLANDMRTDPSDDSERRLDERDRARDMNATMRGML